MMLNIFKHYIKYINNIKTLYNNNIYYMIIEHIIIIIKK